MARILMLYEKFPPFNLSGSARPFQFAKHLPEFGHHPHVIAANVPPGQPRDDAPLAELAGRCDVSRADLLLESTRRFIARRRARAASAPPADPAAAIPAPGRSSYDSTRRFRLYWAVAWRLYWHLDWGGPAVRVGLAAHRRKPVDLVWVSAPHSRNLFAGYWLSVLLRRPLILDLRDPWTYGSLWRPRTPGVETAERQWARRILNRAERIVFTSPLTMQEMQRRFSGRPASRMRTITNGFAETPVEPRRDTHHGKCLFRYVGVLNDRRKPDVILEALKRAVQDPQLAEDVCFQFIGPMAGHERKIDEYGLSRIVEHVGPVSRAESVRRIRGSDVNVLLQTITTGQDAVSGKAFEYLAARKPILAVVSETGGDAWLMRETGAGAVVPFTDPDRIAKAIREYWTLWKQGRLEQSTADVDLSPFTWRSLTARLAALIDEVLRPPQGPAPMTP